ncbi:S-layer homology domain-containing protein [Demequina maris]|uniref:S-layer homology domain-containing protein n=1 Tax=Demequina maris TaxID=1638982 RepID=UPI000784D881|nr:S-layer homology domain-containing protein [Demequina maris]
MGITTSQSAPRAIAGAALMALSASVLTATAAAATDEDAPGSALYGFESAASLEGMSGVAESNVRTSSIAAASGNYYGMVEASNTASLSRFTKFGGYTTAFPDGGWFTSADFYLDTEVDTGGALNQFDWSVAANKADGSHLRDYVLHAQSAGDGTWTLSASNNSGRKGVDVAELKGDTYEISESGWYTVRHEFTDSDGVLSVDISVADAAGEVLHTWTLSNASDVIGDTVGGNRYGWVVANGFDELPIDNVLMNEDRPTEGAGVYTAESFDATCDADGGFSYTVTPYWTDTDRAFQVKSLGDGGGGTDETFYYADGTTGAPGEIVVFAEVAAGETATLELEGLEPGDYTVVSDGSRQVKKQYRYDFTVAAPGACQYFSDVTEGASNFAAVSWMHQNGLADGYADGTYRPTNAVNRAQMARFIYRYVGSPAVDAPAESPFADVSADAGNYEAIYWLVQEGHAAGFDGGESYKPTAKVTRGTMARFLYSLAGEPAVDLSGDSPFADVDPSASNYEAIVWMQQAGIADGFADGTFRSTVSVNRGQMARFLERFDGVVGL